MCDSPGPSEARSVSYDGPYRGIMIAAPHLRLGSELSLGSRIKECFVSSNEASSVVSFRLLRAIVTPILQHYDPPRLPEVAHCTQSPSCH